VSGPQMGESSTCCPATTQCFLLRPDHTRTLSLQGFARESAWTSPAQILGLLVGTTGFAGLEEPQVMSKPTRCRGGAKSHRDPSPEWMRYR